MIPDGIWLNLPAAVYHDDPALGGHDLFEILTNAVQWHAASRNTVWRELHPPSEKESAAKLFGEVFHVSQLEPDAFDERYYVMPEPPDGLPKTKDEINAALASIGRPTLPTARKSIEFQAAARMAGLMLLEDWHEEQASIRGDRKVIGAEWAASLRLLRGMIERHPYASRLLTMEGRSEVSVFWTDAYGVRMKCRFDRLLVRHVPDLKSYAYRAGQEQIQSFCGQADNFGYDFSAAHYMDARVNVLPDLVANKRIWRGAPVIDADGDVTAIPATPDDLAFFAKVAGETDPLWCWIACVTKGFPEVDVLEFPGTLMALQSAQVQVDQARETYRQFRDLFGDDGDNAWVSSRGLVRLTDYNFSSMRARDRGAVRWESGE